MMTTSAARPLPYATARAEPHMTLLADPTVWVAGMGRVGSRMVEGLVRSGTRSVVANDPQRVESSDAISQLHLRQQDCGRSKVEAMHRYLERLNRGVQFRGIVAPTESDVTDEMAQEADICVIASNTLDSRRAGVSRGIRYQKPVIAVGVADARTASAASVAIWRPGAHELACPACLLHAQPEPPRNERLLPSVIDLATAHACHLVICALTTPAELPPENVWLLDGTRHSVTAIELARHPDCEVCRLQGGA